MNLLSQMGAIIALNSGQTLPPQLQQQIAGQKGLFGSILNNAQLQKGGTTGTGALAMPTAPTPPVPPTSASDSVAQLKYQQELQAYNVAFQAYNTQLWATMMRQFQQMQQSMLQAQKAQTTSSTGTSRSGGAATTLGTNSEPIGVASIL
jgi:hypothetical protein